MDRPRDRPGCNPFLRGRRREPVLARRTLQGSVSHEQVWLEHPTSLLAALQKASLMDSLVQWEFCADIRGCKILDIFGSGFSLHAV